jgi:uncharacterized membrane protein AbrB (regulator of aidB expression)
MDKELVAKSFKDTLFLMGIVLAIIIGFSGLIIGLTLSLTWIIENYGWKISIIVSIVVILLMTTMGTWYLRYRGLKKQTEA